MAGVRNVQGRDSSPAPGGMITPGRYVITVFQGVITNQRKTTAPEELSD
jgi:hypothetical protein